MNENDFPNDVDMEKQILAALLFKNGEAVPKVNAILSDDDFYRPEHKILYRTICRLFELGTPPNIASIIDELIKTGELDKIGRKYVISIASELITNAYVVSHAKAVKEKADRRRLIQVAQNLEVEARKIHIPLAEISLRLQKDLEKISRSDSSDTTDFVYFFNSIFHSDLEKIKVFANRKTGFDNIDQCQFFSPGLYVIGATPAAGKTTFCWQLLEQLAKSGETCIFCSYEMSRLELFSKSLARELFRRNPSTSLTAAQIRRGSCSAALDKLVNDFADSQLNLKVMELQDETVDELLCRLKPFCFGNVNAPVVCIDYLQIIPTNRESIKIGIDDNVRKLKKFQRDTNTTFLVISSFNRTNYAQKVSFESFKESGNIEYTADVVWALQLDVMNSLKGGDPISESRRKIDEAKKQQPRQIHLKCLKNRQGTNYDCFFYYHSAHDFFEPCDFFDIIVPPLKKSSSKKGKINDAHL